MTDPETGITLPLSKDPKPYPRGNSHAPPQCSSRHRPIPFNERNRGGGATTSQARSIPWDCADWQAFAHADRPTAILESLAENRGKTLYCGIDQSDTFSKAETWQAGKDRNERDDTIYSGERGIFRGFIAAQEGWLTEGESGITGISIDRIFEFPREKKKRRRRYKNEYRRDAIRDRPEGSPNMLDWVWSDFGPEVSHALYNTAASQAYAAFVDPTGAELRRQALTNPVFKDGVTTNMNANEYCVSLGYRRVSGAYPYLNMSGYGSTFRRAGPGNTGNYIVKARRGIMFRGGADCVRKVRR